MCVNNAFTSTRILIAVDGSTPAEWATEVARSLATTLGGRVLYVYVVEPLVIDQANPLAVTEAERVQREVGEMLLAKNKASTAASLAPETRLLFGQAVYEIAAAADDWKADFIVLGSRGRGRIAQLFVGSTTTGVIRTASCPVIAVSHKPRTAFSAPFRATRRSNRRQDAQIPV